MRLLQNTKFDFLKIQWICIAISLFFIAVGTISLIVKGGPNLGIDFTGGSQIVLGFAQKPDENEIRKIVQTAKVEVTSVQRYDKPEKNQVALSVPISKVEGHDVAGEVTRALTQALFPQGLQEGTFDLNSKGADLLAARLVAEDPEKLSARANADPNVEYARIAQAIVAARSEKGLFKSTDEAAAAPGLSPAVQQWLKARTVAGPFTLISAESVGPQVGKDLRSKGLWAILLSWTAMLLYIAFRFRSASFGTAAVIALIHDTWITLGFCSLLNVEISLTVVASFLTLIGYSVNDTVVIFDRMRENREKHRKMPLYELINLSVNQTLARTFLTSALTFLVVVALFLLGGQVLHAFAFVLLVGLIVGSYSTVFIASPVVLAWENWKVRGQKTNGGQPPASLPAESKKRASR